MIEFPKKNRIQNEKTQNVKISVHIVMALKVFDFVNNVHNYSIENYAVALLLVN